MPAPSALRRELQEARALTDGLFAMVRPGSLFERPVPERHRLNFYVGHLEAFDWNMICDYALGLPPLNEGFNNLFAFGIDPDSGDLPRDVPEDWPGIEETLAYCRRARATIDTHLDRIPETIASACIEHRLMHAETLSYLLHNLPLRHRVPAAANGDRSGRLPAADPEPRWIEIPPGKATLGRDESAGFGWDNEFGRVTVQVPEFAVRQHKVTNGEYLRFVEAGGPAPHYWHRSGRRWTLRSAFGDIPLPLAWPVHVTHAEARQFAAQSGAALPSEAQWDRAAYGSPAGEDRRYPWGREFAHFEDCLFGFRGWDSRSVTRGPGGDSAFGVSQTVGNGWEWTADAFRPFAGFREYEFYPGYSADFFDNEHYVLKGASSRTAERLLRRSFRNWFREDYPYVYATIRLVRN